MRVAEEVVPFYENVFREEHRESGKFILKDPYLLARARPLEPAGFLGPTDLLGFRNRAVPNSAGRDRDRRQPDLRSERPTATRGPRATR